MIQVVCEVCGKGFLKYPSCFKMYNHNYCSKHCMGIALRKSKLWVDHNCLYCGKVIQVKGGHWRKYCSRQCAGDARRKKDALWRNPEYIKSYMQGYVQNNKEKLREKGRERAKSNPALYNGIKRQWSRNHRAEVALLNTHRYEIKRNGKITKEEWGNIKILYDHRCARCRKQEPAIKLELDHIIPLSKGGEHNMSNVQPLCHHCNASKMVKAVRYRLC